MQYRVAAMEEAMRTLDVEHVFGVGAQRDAIVINVEFTPPDWTNTQRAKRLNPSAALVDWLAEKAE